MLLRVDITFGVVLGLLLVAMVTSASVQDRPGGKLVLARLGAAFPSIALVWADGGYANSIDDGLLSWAKDKLGLVVQIVRRTDDVKGYGWRAPGWSVRSLTS